MVARVSPRNLMAYGKQALGFDPAVDVLSQLDRPVGAAATEPRLRARIGRSAVLGLQSVSTYPGFKGGWYPLRQARELAAAHPLAAVISTSPPPSVHRLAADVSAACRVPWIADLRDLWSENYHYPWGSLRRAAERRLEHRVLGRAHALTTVSEPFAATLRRDYPSLAVHVVMNAIDPVVLSEPAIAPRNETLRLTYTGVIYDGNQRYDLLLAGLAYMKQVAGPRCMELHVAAPAETWLTLEAAARRHDVLDMCVYRGHVSRDEARRLQRASDVLVLFSWWGDAAQRGFVPSKVFEYLGARRPVLVVGSSDDVVAGVVAGVDGGVAVKTLDETQAALQRWHAEWAERGFLPSTSDPAGLRELSQPVIGERFAAIVRSVGSGGSA
jgi:glycosyltransferase involved in cell wall biosynthesis